MSLFRDQQYTYCKVVGRGLACELVKEILGLMMERHSYHYESTTCKSINKFGKLVDEMHVIISDEGGSKFTPSQRYVTEDVDSRRSNFSAGQNSHQPRQGKLRYINTHS